MRSTTARVGTSSAKGKALLTRLFPKTQLIFRTDGRVRLMTLSTGVQSVMAIVGICALGWAASGLMGKSPFETGSVLIGQSALEKALAGKDREIATITAAYNELKANVGNSENRFRTVARTLEAKHAYLMALLDRRDASGATLRSLPSERTADDPSLKRIESSRRALLAQLGALELVLQNRNDRAGDTADTMFSGRISLTAAQMLHARREHRRLVARIEKLEDRLLRVNGSQRGVMDLLAAHSIDDFARAKKLVAISGIDVDAMLARIGDPDTSAQGGPFVAAAPETRLVKSVPVALGVIDHQLDRWESLSALIGRLPLAAPANNYYVSGKFGRRRDPINGRWAMHYGVDLAGPHRSPVLSTAPGVVVEAGWKGHYGRVIEIDHGLGLRTRYGHLRKILVKRGQKVDFRHQIGQMGSSGRSTGTHVHYEILLNGKPVDPAKFMKAGRHVLEGY